MTSSSAEADVFPSEELLLGGDTLATAVASDLSVRRQNPVAGDDNRQRIGADRPSYSPGGAGFPDCTPQLAVTDCLSVGDFLQGRPDRLLEIGAFRLEWEVEGGSGACKVLGELRNRILDDRVGDARGDTFSELHRGQVFAIRGQSDGSQGALGARAKRHIDSVAKAGARCLAQSRRVDN